MVEAQNYLRAKAKVCQEEQAAQPFGCNRLTGLVNEQSMGLRSQAVETRSPVFKVFVECSEPNEPCHCTLATLLPIPIDHCSCISTSIAMEFSIVQMTQNAAFPCPSQFLKNRAAISCDHHVPCRPFTSHDRG